MCYWLYRVKEITRTGLFQYSYFSDLRNQNQIVNRQSIHLELTEKLQDSEMATFWFYVEVKYFETFFSKAPQFIP